MEELIFKNDEFSCVNKLNIYSNNSLRSIFLSFVKKLQEYHIYNKTVVILAKDNFYDFLLSFALKACNCIVMFIARDNGQEYTNSILEHYKPDVVIGKLNCISDFSLDIFSKVGTLSHLVEDEEYGVYLIKGYNNKNSVLGKNKGFIFFTSGTTSVPKAVFRSDSTVISDAVNNINTFSINKEDKLLVLVPYGHVYGFGSGVLPFAMKGALIVFAPQLISAKKISNLIKQYNINCIIGSPVNYQEMLHTDFPSDNIKLLLSAGSKIGKSLLCDFYSKYGLELNNMYGSSETGAISTLYKHKIFDGNDMNCGRAMNGVELCCNGTVDNPGIIRIKSNAIADGYLENGTIQSIRDSNEWFETNDMGYLDEDNNINIVCRVDDMINIGGEKINPRMIEAVAEKYTSEAIIRTEKREDGFDDLVMYVLDKDINTESLLQELKERFTVRFMPKKLYYVKELPRNQNGKVMRKNLEICERFQIL